MTQSPPSTMRNHCTKPIAQLESHRVEYIQSSVLQVLNFLPSLLFCLKVWFCCLINSPTLYEIFDYGVICMVEVARELTNAIVWKRRKILIDHILRNFLLNSKKVCCWNIFSRKNNSKCPHLVSITIYKNKKYNLIFRKIEDIQFLFFGIWILFCMIW